MKTRLTFYVIFLALFIGCKIKPDFTLLTIQNKIIAIQPLDGFSKSQLDSIAESIRTFYGARVKIFSPMEMPEKFYHPLIKQYSADSVIAMLAKNINDSIVEIIGLTHRKIFTMKGTREQYVDANIFGFGFQPGNACVISCSRFNAIDASKFKYGFRNSIIHEVGHNLGLSHCNDRNCIMSEANGNIYKLSESEMNYCSVCRKKLNRP